jgi:hypothetical protein
MGQFFRRLQLSGNGSGLLKAFACLRRIARLFLGVAQRQKKIELLVFISVVLKLQDRQAMLIVIGGLFVSQQAGSPLRGSDSVIHCLVAVARRRGLIEVIGEFGEMHFNAAAVEVLEYLPDPPMQPHSPGNADLVVQRLPDQRVDKTVSTDELGRFIDYSRRGGFIKQLQQPVG